MSAGTTYGKYFLLKPLAAGGMGEIFLAKQQGPAGFEKVVVIKRILAHLTRDPQYLELFLQEARLQARMAHGCIAQIFDLGQADDGSYYLAMEYVHGRSLVDLLERLRKTNERLPPALACQIIERACEGLSYAHNMTDGAGSPLNIIHRDISPHNILISSQGEIKLIDFGIAKSSINVVQTECGRIKGKFYYMSPEQSAAGKLDKRSDIFSLGIVLYECLTLVNPFVHENVLFALQAIQATDPPPPSTYAPDLRPLDAIVAKALAKDARDRYADAADLRDDLTRVRLAMPNPERLGPYLLRVFKDSLEADAHVFVRTQNSAEAVAPARQAAKNASASRSLRASQEADGTVLRSQSQESRVATGSRRAAKPSPDEVEEPCEPTFLPGVSDQPEAEEDVEEPCEPTFLRQPTGERAQAGDEEAQEPCEPTLTPSRGSPALAPKADPEVAKATVFTAPAPKAKGKAGRTPPKSATPPRAGKPLRAPAQETVIRQPEPAVQADEPPSDGAPTAAVLSQAELEAAALGSRKGLYAGLGIAAALLLGVGGYVAFGPSPSQDATQIPDPVGQPNPKPLEDDKAKLEAEAKKAEEARKAEEAKKAEAAKADEERKAAEAKSAEVAKADEERKAAEAKKEADAKLAQAQKDKTKGEKAEAPKKPEPTRPTEPTKPPPKVAAVTPAPARKLGALSLTSVPAGSFKLDGRAIGKTAELAGASGVIEHVCADCPFKVRLSWSDQGLQVGSEPWALVSVNDIAKGKTPQFLPFAEGMTVIELKKPGVETTLKIMARFARP